MGAFTHCPYESFAAVSTVTAVSENSSFPASNVSSYTTPNRPYKSSSAAGTTQALVLDMGAATSLDGVMVDHINVTSIVVQGNATDSWASPSYSGTFTISRDALDSRYKVFVDLQSTAFDSTGYRYLRIKCNTATTQFGGTVWQVGAVIPMGTVVTWDTNTGPGHGRVRMQAVDQGNKPGGGAEPAAVGNVYCRIILPAAELGTAMQATYDTLMANGEHQPVVFWRNNGSTAEAYVAHRVGIVQVDTNTNHVQVDALIFEEYV